MKNGKTDKPNYPESLAPSKEFIEAVEKQEYSAYGYDERNDCYFAVPYEGSQPLAELGHKIYFIHPENPYLNQKELFEMMLKMSKGEDAYIFHEKDKQLYYSSNGYLEAVSIHDNTLFLQTFKKICGDEEYDYNFLTFEQINELITANGGHKPSKLETSLANSQNIKHASRLLNDLFPPKKVDVADCWASELNLDKLFL
ncbi:hypothetical protein Lsan_3861 [Legionella santicrucis]|uniref:Uncharacterized protein n=1 Tax=Legionella santicrucis TaxID=45074 RepID=A0A0W0Y922_9GAMM|nr:hypothetical protein [Legionella santicrucis]KTD53451.1 hypothetical protein Lsan_3861 [Legionella santicrucis]